MFHLLIKVGILPFYIHRFFKFNLKLSSRRVQDLAVNNPVNLMFDKTLDSVDA